MPEQPQLACRLCATVTAHSGPRPQTTPDCTERRLITIATYACVGCGSMHGYRVPPAKTVPIDASQHQT